MAAIGILSDTHNLLRREAGEILRSCDCILHAGDICRKEILNELSAIAPVYAVRGNNDNSLTDSLPETRRIELYGYDFFMIHDRNQIHEDIGKTDFIIYGHSHRYEEFTGHGVHWLNPGSCGPVRFRLPQTMAVMEIGPGRSYRINKILLSGNTQVRPV